MKTLMSLSLMFLNLHTFLPLCHSLLLPSDNNLIEHVCQQTPHYDLCFTSLESDPRSKNADLEDLATIMVDVTHAKAVYILNYIGKLLKERQQHHHRMRRRLNTCARKYLGIVRGDVPEALAALKSGNYKFAEVGVNDAAVEAKDCQEEFKNHASPLLQMNKVMSEVCAVTASIVNLLL